jgi:hypothetical protein
MEHLTILIVPLVIFLSVGSVVRLGLRDPPHRAVD